MSTLTTLTAKLEQAKRQYVYARHYYPEMARMFARNIQAIKKQIRIIRTTSNNEAGQSVIEFAFILAALVVIGAIVVLAFHYIFGVDFTATNAWYTALCNTGAKWACK